VTPNGDGRLRVDLSAATNAGTPSNQLTEIRVTAQTNAVVYLDLYSQSVPFSENLPPGTTTKTLYVARQTAGQAASATIVVTDGCGDWPTFVGGGPSAF
jgi:hypothetical protein